MEVEEPKVVVDTPPMEEIASATIPSKEPKQRSHRSEWRLLRQENESEFSNLWNIAGLRWGDECERDILIYDEEGTRSLYR